MRKGVSTKLFRRLPPAIRSLSRTIKRTKSFSKTPKGVSAILASVLIVLIVVSLSGAFLVYSQRTATQLTEGATKQQQTLQQQLDVQFILEGVSGSQATLRNIGENDITYGTLSIFLDDVLINYTLPSAIAPGQTGTLYLNQTWRAGLGEKTLRVTGRSLSDSVRVRVDKPAGNILDLRLDEGNGRQASDSGRSISSATLSGTLFGDFEGTLDGFSEGCNPGSVSYETGAIGQGVKVWSTGGTGTRCLVKNTGTTAAHLVGYTVFFYAKGYVETGLWNGTHYNTYVEDVEADCKTGNGATAVYAACNNNQPYDA